MVATMQPCTWLPMVATFYEAKTFLQDFYTCTFLHPLNMVKILTTNLKEPDDDSLVQQALDNSHYMWI